MKIAIKSCFTTLVEDTTPIQNAATPYPVEFAFSKDWDGFAKTAFFEAGGVSMAVVLSEDKCDIPGECLKKGGIPLKIAVYGVKGEERKSTGWHVTSKILFPANISIGTGGSGDPMGDASLLADSNYIYFVGADAGTRNVYDNYGVSAGNVTTSGQMTFRCDTTPTVDLSVFIIRLEVGTDE